MANADLTITKTDNLGEVVFVSAGLAFADVQTTDLDLGAPDNQKYVDVIRLHIKDLRGADDLSVEIGTRDNLTDPIVFSATQFIKEGMDEIFVRLTAKYFTVRLGMINASGFFVWGRLEFYGALAGRRIF